MQGTPSEEGGLFSRIEGIFTKNHPIRQENVPYLSRLNVALTRKK